MYYAPKRGNGWLLSEAGRVNIGFGGSVKTDDGVTFEFPEIGDMEVALDGSTAAIAIDDYTCTVTIPFEIQSPGLGVIMRMVQSQRSLQLGLGTLSGYFKLDGGDGFDSVTLSNGLFTKMPDLKYSKTNSTYTFVAKFGLALPVFVRNQ